MRSSLGKWIAILVKVLVLAGLVYLISRNVDSDVLLEMLRDLHPGYLFGALGCLIMVPATMGWRLSYVARTPMKRGVICLLKAFYFNLFLPAQMGGDIYKMYSLSKDVGERKKAVAVVFGDRLIGMAGGVAFALCNVVMGRSFFTEPMIYRAIAAYIAIVLVAFLAIFLVPDRLFELFGFLRPLRGLLDKLKKTRKYLRTTLRTRVAGGIGITLICYLFLIGMNLCAIKALGYSLNIQASLLYMPVISVVSLTLPISFNGLGVRESLYMLLFQMASFSGEASLAMAGVHLVCIMAVSVIGGVMVLVSGDRIKDVEANTNDAKSLPSQPQ